MSDHGFSRGDIVAWHGKAGIVKRVACDGSWVDVFWGGWSKRQRKPSILNWTGYTVQDALAWTGTLAEALGKAVTA